MKPNFIYEAYIQILVFQKLLVVYFAFLYQFFHFLKSKHFETYFFIYLWLHWVLFGVWAFLQLLQAGATLYLCVQGPLIAVPSLVEHRL